MAEASLRETLQAAYRGEDAPAAPETPQDAAPAPVAPSGPQDAMAPSAPLTAASDEAPQRDAAGRFIPKEASPSAAAPPAAPVPAVAAAPPPSAAPAAPQAAEPASTEAPKEPIRVPPSLTPAMKAKFATLDPDIQQSMWALEESVQTAKSEWGKKGERLNRYEEIMAPRKEMLRLQGLDEFSSIQSLLAAQDLLEKSPLEAIQWLAHSYGVNLAQFAQMQMNGGYPQPGGQPQPGGFDPNALQAALNQALTPLQQRLQSFEQQAEAREMADATRTVEAVAQNPANIYWEDVKPVVAHLIRSGLADDVQTAYDMACWSSPAIRPLLQAQAAPAAPIAVPAAPAVDPQAAARVKAERARAAAVSITGGPSGATQPAGTSTGNLREDLIAAMHQHVN